MHRGTLSSAMATSRFFNSAAIVSAIVCGGVAVAWNCSDDGRVDPQKHYITLTDRCHLGIDCGGRLLAFNDPAVPQVGCVLWSVSGNRQTPGPNAPVYSQFGKQDLGLLYFKVRLANGKSYWTLSIQLIYPLLLSAALPAMWFVRQRSRPGRGFAIDMAERQSRT